MRISFSLKRLQARAAASVLDLNSVIGGR
jgi:hypothetical protein